MIKNLLKIFLLCVGIVGGLILIVAIVIKIILPPEKIKNIIIQQSQGYLNRNVKIDRLSIDVFKGIEISGIKIFEKDTKKGEIFFECASINLKARLMPLLRKEIFINEMSVLSPKINIRKLPSKKFNFSDIAEKIQHSHTKIVKFYYLPLLTTGKLKIENGTVNFADLPPTQQSFDIKNLTINITNMSTTKPFYGNASFNLAKDKLCADISLTTMIDIKTKKIKIENLIITDKYTYIKASATVTDFSDLENLSYELALSVDKLTLENLFHLPATRSLTISGFANGKINLSGNSIKISAARGDADIYLKDIKLGGFKIIDTIKTLLNTSSIEYFTFAQGYCRIKINNGELNIIDIKTSGGDKLDFSATGSVSLTNRKYNINGVIKFAPKYSGGDLAKYLYSTSADRRITIPFKLGGSFDRPSVSLEWNKTLEENIRKAKEFLQKVR